MMSKSAAYFDNAAASFWSAFSVKHSVWTTDCRGKMQTEDTMQTPDQE